MKNKPKCKYCYDKGYSTQLVNIHTGADFFGDKTSDKMEERKIPCPKCHSKPKECKHKIEYGFPTCSKCGESIIVEPKEPQRDIIKGWEEEFDKEVGVLHQDGYRIDDFVKSFIRTLLADQKSQLIKEIDEIIIKIEIPKNCDGEIYQLKYKEKVLEKLALLKT